MEVDLPEDFKKMNIYIQRYPGTNRIKDIIEGYFLIDSIRIAKLEK
jgi:hypothetical protein